MKKIYFLFVLIMILSIGLAYAESYEVNFTDFSTYRSNFANIQINSLKYEPYPVDPGDYFTLWIKAENIGDEVAKNATFELLPEYPFSLDSNENPIREFGQLSSEEPVVMNYKVRVNKDAVEGTNEIELRYSANGDKDSWVTKKFDIEVEDSQTDFDLVLQEVSGTEASIAIANTGKNIAYSVIVKIPDQEDFQTVGTNGQMVGNLDNGDYTLVGFEITPKRSGSVKSSDNNKMLKVQIDYTDEIGERRSMIKDIPFDSQSNGLSGSGLNATTIAQRRANFAGNNTTNTSIYQKWWFWGIIIIVLFGAWKGYKIFKQKREEKEEKEKKSKK